jgi:hypothetical protein
MIVGRRPWDARGAAVDAVVKHAGDDVGSLVIDALYRDAMTGAHHSERFDDVERIMASGPDDQIRWLADFILVDLDERILAIG